MEIATQIAENIQYESSAPLTTNEKKTLIVFNNLYDNWTDERNISYHEHLNKTIAILSYIKHDWGTFKFLHSLCDKKTCIIEEHNLFYMGDLIHTILNNPLCHENLFHSGNETHHIHHDIIKNIKYNINIIQYEIVHSSDYRLYYIDGNTVHYIDEGNILIEDVP